MSISHKIALGFCGILLNLSVYAVDFETVWETPSSLTVNEKKAMVSSLSALQTQIKQGNKMALKDIPKNMLSADDVAYVSTIQYLRFKPNFSVVDFRQDNATAAQKKMKFYPNHSDNGYPYYYLDNKKKKYMSSICDQVTSGKWLVAYFVLTVSDEPNRLTPDAGDGCMTSRHYFFLQEAGHLKIKGNIAYP